MAFAADCGSSTVLEALCVASAVRFIVPGECRVVMCRRDACTGWAGNSKLKTKNSKLFRAGQFCESAKNPMKWAM